MYVGVSRNARLHIDYEKNVLFYFLGQENGARICLTIFSTPQQKRIQERDQ